MPRLFDRPESDPLVAWCGLLGGFAFLYVLLAGPPWNELGLRGLVRLLLGWSVLWAVLVVVFALPLVLLRWLYRRVRRRR